MILSREQIAVILDCPDEWLFAQLVPGLNRPVGSTSSHDLARTALHLYDENERLQGLQSDAELWLAQERAVRGLLAQAEVENERLRDALRDMLDITTGWTAIRDIEGPSLRIEAIEKIARKALSHAGATKEESR